MTFLRMLGSVTDRILTFPPWLVLLVVFLVPALEASAFIGFVFPGEIVVLLGGVAAWRGTVPLWTVMVAAAAGAIIGDTAGYFIGRRWGRGMLHGTIGRLPIVKRHLDTHLDSAEAYVRRRQGSAVFFGRFTTALRVLVPGLAGMSGVHYPTFLMYNVAGGVLWGAGFALLGYLGGASYHHVASVASRVGLIVLGLVVAGLLLGRFVRTRARRSGRLREWGKRIASSAPVEWTRRRFPSQFAWAKRRLELSSPRGFPLTFALAVAALTAWWFGGLTQDVVSHDDTYLLDPHVLSWVVAHRSDALSSFMQIITWLGSTAILYPALVVIGALFWWRRRDWRPAALLAASTLGAVALYNIVKGAVERARPPERFWIGHYTGWAFPSGHATQTIAFYGMLAFLLSAAARSVRARVWIWAGAALITLVVGASRIYLAAHWMTDVLGGYALGACWLSLVLAFAFWRQPIPKPQVPLAPRGPTPVDVLRPAP
jgi:undecaprenyl-diphosphatase